MVSYINKRFGGLKPSATLAVKQKAMELKAAGVSVIDLSAGEPDIDTPDHIKEATVVALKEGKTKYTAVPGIPELRSELARYYSDQHNTSYASDNVVVCNGGKQGIYQALSVTLEQGQEVVIPAPYWVSYPPMVELAGGVPIVVPTAVTNRYLLTPEELDKALTPRTRFVVLCSPSNPTGMGYSAEHLQRLGDVVLKAVSSGRCPDLMVLADEVYEKLTFPHFTFASFARTCPALNDRTVTVGACSKSYSMTGWRVGWVVGPAPIISAIGKYQSQTTSNVCSIAQWGGLAALKGSCDFLPKMIESFSRRTAMAMEMINSTPGLSLPYAPDGAFYLFVRIDDLCIKGKVKDALDYANRMLEVSGVAVVPGNPFGDDRAFRMSTASSDENVRAGLERLVSGTRSL